MIITYLRSSSIVTQYQCEMKYFGEYVLGIKGEPRQKTVMGSMFHKIMEGVALEKQAIQNKKKKFYPSEIGGFPVGCGSRALIDKAYNYYAQKHPEYTWSESQKKDLTKWYDSVILLEQGEFNPANLNVLDVEKYFDIEIKEDWAKYKYTSGEGYLSLKGTIDLIVDHDDHIEIIDWKTGARKNWLTGKEKNYEDFREDKQLLLYYYVAHHLYKKPISITIVYVNSGGSFSMDFSEEDYVRAEEMVKETFSKIKNIKYPKLIRPDRFCGFCPLYKTYFDDPKKWPNGDPKDKCYHLKDEIYQIGLTNTIQRHTKDQSHIYNYTEGGGRESK